MTKLNIPKNTLAQLYVREGLTTYNIAERFNCCQTTIWKRLHQFGIKPRWPWNAVKFSKEKLAELYQNRCLSTWEIEKRWGFSRGTVHRKLKEWCIPTRNIAISHIKYYRNDFSGDLIEKAHLIGFRIGDLNVTKRSSKSETIFVKCASTKVGQILLFRKLFGKYGQIWEGKPTRKKRINIQVSLNLSFRFFIKKWAQD